MRRLREHQFVTIEVDRPNASIECLVVAIDGGEATLEAVNAAQAAAVSVDGANALLTFEYRSQLISLRGTARRNDAADDLRFTVTDRVTVPQRRRYARVEVAVPTRLTPLDPDGNSAAGEPTATRTRDLSADGLLVEELLPPSEQIWRVELELPDGGPPIVSQGRIVRNVGGGTAMRYSAIRPEDRQRLKQFVAARKRKILAELRKDS
jgi:hypothetical protein